MKVTVSGKPEEIASLALELQKRLKEKPDVLIRKPYSDELIFVPVSADDKTSEISSQQDLWEAENGSKKLKTKRR